MPELGRREFITGAALSALAVLPGKLAAEPPKGKKHPNILLLIADDLGDRDAGCYGHPTIRTPSLDRIAAGGMRFTNAFVTTSSCSPSRASMFTGRYPHATGAEALHMPLPEGTKILPTYLSELGYFTANVGKLHLGPVGAARFDRVEERPTDWKQVLEERPRKGPFFLAVGFRDPHRPYQPDTVPDPTDPADVIVPPYLVDTSETRADLAGYYDECLRMDRETAKILDWLKANGLEKDTLVIFVSDNGMPFPRAKTTCYDSGVRVPFLVRWPGRVPERSVSQSLISTVDLTPTILSILGRKVPEAMQGTDASPLFFDPRAGVRAYVHIQRNWHNLDDHQRGCRDKRYKYIKNNRPRMFTTSSDLLQSPSYLSLLAKRDLNQLTAEQMRLWMIPRPGEELYDTWTDPFEFTNLAADTRYAQILERMRAETERWRAATGDYPPGRRYKDNLDIFTREKYGKTSGAPERYEKEK
jgi:N-sulfoglucosamine sulfohydrolase